MIDWQAKEREAERLRDEARGRGCNICHKPIETGSYSFYGDVKDGYVAVHSDCARPPDTREVRACARCGYERKIAIRRYWQQRTGSQDLELRESYHRLCTACDCIGSAEVHERMARKMRAKAAAIIAKRKKP